MVRQSLDTLEQSGFSEEKRVANLSNSSCQASQYAIADVAFFPSGHRRVLACARGDTEVRHLLHEPVADLFSQCQTFKTIDEHVETYCQERQLSEAIRSKLQYQLQQLAQEGYLISSSQLDQLFQAASQETSPSPITSMVFPTCNHVEELQRGMISYIQHCQRFGHDIDFVVGDDSKTPAMREAYETCCAP